MDRHASRTSSRRIRLTPGARSCVPPLPVGRRAPLSDAADCLFCGIVAGEIPGDIVHTTERTVAFRDLNAQAPTHVLVVPKDHYANAAELAAADPAGMAELVTDRARGGHGRGPRRLPPGAQHRCRRRAVRLPHAPARARGPFDDLAAGMSRSDKGSPGCASAWRRSSGWPVSASAWSPGAAPTTRSGGPLRQRTRRTPRRSRCRTTTRRRCPTGPVKARKLRDGRAAHDADRCPRRTRRRRRPATGPTTTAASCSTRDLPEDAWLTGTQILPGNPEIVHHVILFRVSESEVAAGRGRGRRIARAGLDLLRRDGPRGRVQQRRRRRVAGGLGARWPRDRRPEGLRRLPRQGTRIVMQVHYNLLLGDGPDLSATQIRWTPKAGSDIQGVHTTLLPAPVELPCRSRARARAAVRPRGVGRGRQGAVRRRHRASSPTCCTCCAARTSTPTQTTSCTRTIPRSMTVLGAAGHMHLLGQWIRIEANPGTPESTEVLDIPLWNFDDQGAQSDRAAAPRRRRHPAGHLPPQPGAARPAAGVRGHPGEVRRLGRGHHRRDVSRHPPGRLRRRGVTR